MRIKSIVGHAEEINAAQGKAECCTSLEALVV